MTEILTFPDNSPIEVELGEGNPLRPLRPLLDPPPPDHRPVPGARPEGS